MIKKIKDNIWQFSFEKFGSCIYLIKLPNHSILIDTSSNLNRQELIKDLESLNIKLSDIDIVLITHNHYDHIGNIDLFSNANLYSYKNIRKFPIKEIEIIKTPGHTNDSLSFYLPKDKILFSGDTLFHNGIGRTDFPESSPKDMQNSLKKLENLDYEILCPGHLN